MCVDIIIIHIHSSSSELCSESSSVDGAKQIAFKFDLINKIFSAIDDDKLKIL